MPASPGRRWASGRGAAPGAAAPGVGGGRAVTPAANGQPAARLALAVDIQACGSDGLASSGSPESRRGPRRPGLGRAGPPAGCPGLGNREASAASPLSVLGEAAGYCLTSPPTFQFV